MNEQQLAAIKLALEALEMGLGQISGDYDTAVQKAIGAVTALQCIIVQPAPVQEPDGYVYGNSYWEATNLRITDDVKRFGSPRYATPPAPQPVPVKTYHDGTPWPVAPNPWVGLTDEEVVQCQQGDVYHFYRCIEAKLKEKNT